MRIYIYYPSISNFYLSNTSYGERRIERERARKTEREREREIKLMYTSYTSMYCFPVICCYKTFSIGPGMSLSGRSHVMTRLGPGLKL